METGVVYSCNLAMKKKKKKKKKEKAREEGKDARNDIEIDSKAFLISQ